jgi:hypothetical protein
MTIPASGPVSSSMINVELGRVSTTLFSLKNASDGVYEILNRNSNAGLIIYNDSLSGTNYSMDSFHGLDQNATTLFDYSFTNNASSDIDDISIDFDTGNQVVYVANLASSATVSNANIDTTKSGGGWYVYFANNPVDKSTLVDIYLYDVDTGATLYSLGGAIANNYNGQSIGPTIEYYRHIGLDLTYSDP